MLVKDIYSYYAEIGCPGERALANYWLDAWRAAGWTPHILTPEDAMRHPKAPMLLRHVRTLPTVNMRRYEDACYVRWLAFAQQPGVMTDYDVFPVKPVMPHREVVGLINGQPHHGIGWVAGETPEAIERIVDTILAYSPQPDDRFKGRPHVSDMTIIVTNRTLFNTVEPIVAGYDCPDWFRYPAVHFHNGSLRRRKTMSKLNEIKMALANQRM